VRRPLSVFGLFVAAFLLRCRFIGDVFLEGRVLPFDPDSSIHLWRIETAVRDHLQPARFDPFLNAPDGARVILPDGFAVLLAAFARLFHGAGQSRYQVQVACMLAMPLLGAVAVLGVYALGRRIYGHAVGLAAGAIAALLPAHILGGMLGHVDHHVIELALPPFVLALLLGAASAGGARRTMALALGAGALLGVFVHCVPSALLHLAVLTAALVAASIGAAHTGERDGARRLLLGTAVACAVAAALTQLDGRMRDGFAFYRPSALAPVGLLAAAVATFALSQVARRGESALVALAAGLALMAGAALFGLRDALGFVGRAGVLSLVTESQPITVDPFGAVELLTLALPLVPIALVLAARRSPSAGSWALLAAGLAGLALSCLQGRFAVLLAPTASVALGKSTVELWGRSARMRVAVALVALAAFAPCVRYLARTSLTGVEELSTLEAAEWLARNTPPAGERSGHTRPPYTVLAMWGVGSHYAYLADRPLVAGGLYHGDYADGLNDDLAALFGDDDPAPILDRRRVEWVVLPVLAPEIEAAHRQIMGLGAPAHPSLYTQLFDHDGAAMLGGGRVFPALDRLRLVHESPFAGERAGRAVPAVKIFRRVKGALLVGRCDSPRVVARIRAVNDQGRAVELVNQAGCANGVFGLRLPYPGSAQVALGPGRPPATVEVSEADVQSGNELAVP